MAIWQLSREEGISGNAAQVVVRGAWCKGQLLPTPMLVPKAGLRADKFVVVLETAALNEADLSEYCPGCGGLYPAQITACAGVACEQANDWNC